VKVLALINKLNLRFDMASEGGQALVEYALIIGSIALLAIGTLEILGANVDAVLDHVASGFGSF
jgi:Flp pilus assembly pilin Flp